MGQGSNAGLTAGVNGLDGRQQLGVHGGTKARGGIPAWGGLEAVGARATVLRAVVVALLHTTQSQATSGTPMTNTHKTRGEREQQLQPPNSSWRTLVLGDSATHHNVREGVGGLGVHLVQQGVGEANHGLALCQPGGVQETNNAWQGRKGREEVEGAGGGERGNQRSSSRKVAHTQTCHHNIKK